MYGSECHAPSAVRPGPEEAGWGERLLSLLTLNVSVGT